MTFDLTWPLPTGWGDERSWCLSTGSSQGPVWPTRRRGRNQEEAQAQGSGRDEEDQTTQAGYPKARPTQGGKTSQEEGCQNSK